MADGVSLSRRKFTRTSFTVRCRGEGGGEWGKMDFGEGNEDQWVLDRIDYLQELESAQ